MSGPAAPWRNRIVGHGTEDPSKLLPEPAQLAPAPYLGRITIGALRELDRAPRLGRPDHPQD